MRGAVAHPVMALLAQLVDPGGAGPLVLFGSGAAGHRGGPVRPGIVVRGSGRNASSILPLFTVVANLSAR